MSWETASNFLTFGGLYGSSLIMAIRVLVDHLPQNNSKTYYFFKRPFWGAIPFIILTLVFGNWVIGASPTVKWLNGDFKAGDRNFQSSNSSDQPSSPKVGPIGPIAAVEFSETIDEAAKPCTIRVTSPDDNKNLRDTLRWIINNGHCVPMAENSLPSDDPPGVVATQKPGIVVHWDINSILGEKIAKFFASSGVDLRISHHLPPELDRNIVWIDIGPGSIWKDKS